MAPRVHLLYNTFALLFAGQAFAQRYDGQFWPCNPTTNATGSCTPNTGLDQYSYSIDFTNPPSNLADYWSTSDFANITYNTMAKNGAELTFWKAGQAPQLYSNFMILFGHVDVVLKVAPGVGMITSSVLLSDDFDEIDWEMSGNNFNIGQYYSGGVVPAHYKNGVVQNNYFGKGITGAYDRGQWEACTNPQTEFHTYSVDWTPTRVEWLIDGVVVRTLLAANADNTTHQFPQTPSRIQVGIWDGGAATEDYGTYAWAGGKTNVSLAPFTAFVKSISIKNYYPAMYYNWTDQSGKWTSIKQLNTSLPASYYSTTTTASSTTSILPLKTNLPVTENGHCGVNSSTICGGAFGNCCSFYGYCGSTTEYCGTGCQTDYGLCGSQNAAGNASVTGSTTLSVASTSTSTSFLPLLTNLPVSSTGHCGKGNGTICEGSAFGDCCSQYGFCGSGSEYCDVGEGCQSAYGSYNDTSAGAAVSGTLSLTTTVTSMVVKASSAAGSSSSSASSASRSSSAVVSTTMAITASSSASSATKSSSPVAGTTTAATKSSSITASSASSHSSSSSVASATSKAASSSVNPTSSPPTTSSTAKPTTSLTPVPSTISTASSTTKTSSSTFSSAVVLASAISGAVCMKYDGSTITDSNGEAYAITCNAKNTGTVITTVNSATNIPECLPYCDKLPACKAIMFHEDANLCSLLSNVGANTYADKYNLAVRQVTGSASSSVKGTTSASLTTTTKASSSSTSTTTSSVAAAQTMAWGGNALENLLSLLQKLAQERGSGW